MIELSIIETIHKGAFLEMVRKVLFITTIGGFLQQFEMNDIAILKEKGYEIHYASNFDNPVYDFNIDELGKQGIILHHIDIEKSPGQIRKNILAFKQVKKILKSEKFDAVHCHNPLGGVLGRLSCIGTKTKVIYTAHGFHFYKGAPLLNWLFYYPVEYILARWTDGIVTINKEDYERVKKMKLRRGGFIERIPGVGIDTQKFMPHPELKKEVRAELGIPDSAFYILSVGELNKNKNHKTILEAIASLSDQNIYFGICGKGHEKEELLDTAKKLGLEKRFFLYGFRNDIPRMLQAADCFVFPSIREGLGIAAIEAMATGIPLITSDCRGTREYMHNEENGLVCFKGTPQEYADNILKMRDNTEMRNRMSKACVAVSKGFAVEKTDKHMRNLYNKLL